MSAAISSKISLLLWGVSSWLFSGSLLSITDLKCCLDLDRLEALLMADLRRTWGPTFVLLNLYLLDDFCAMLI